MAQVSQIRKPFIPSSFGGKNEKKQCSHQKRDHVSQNNFEKNRAVCFTAHLIIFNSQSSETLHRCHESCVDWPHVPT